MASTDEFLFGLKKKILYEKYIEDATTQLTKPESYILNDSILNYDVLAIFFKNNNNYRSIQWIPGNVIADPTFKDVSFLLGMQVPGTGGASYEKGTHWSQCTMFGVSEDGITITQLYSSELRLRPSGKTDSGNTNYVLRIEKVVGLKFI